MGFDAEDRSYPYFDPEIASVVIGHAGTEGEFMVSVSPMLFNDRVLVTHRSQYPLTVAAGFCYPREGGAASVAAALWVEHWDEMDVPPGFVKEAFNCLPIIYGKGSRQ